MNKIIERLYNDFFRPSKEAEYEKILVCAKEAGYEFHTMLSFEDVIEKGIDPSKKYLIMRRDIDTADHKILKKFLGLEKKYDARATYYFRWSTINKKLMNEIAQSGGESSYHFEEIATYCYRHRIRSKNDLLPHMEEIRDILISNIIKFRNVTGQPCLTIASHGDYVNTKFQFQNKELVDERVRAATSIVREAYDRKHFDVLTCRIADQVEVNHFTEKAIEAINRGEPVLELLTHPRQWNSPLWINFKEEFTRVLKGLYMQL